MANQLNGLSKLLEVLPPVVREKLHERADLKDLIEVVLDYGRPAEARFFDVVERWPTITVSEHDIEYVVKSLGEFGEDNRAGIERTLHRISAIRNRHGKVIGLTCRVGRALEGTIDIIDDIVRSGKSVLILGKPGIGKTTKLREVARVLADEANRRVVIVDTSNEIGGDGDVPHPAIGSARRMQVKNPGQQHNVMIEAVENHMPEVIVIDEIGNEAEAHASRTIAERGVQLIATAHGQSLENVMLNPSLCDLIGGIQAVTLSDDEAKRRGTQKTVLERKAPPTFDIVIELHDFDKLAVHHDVQKTVDLLLRGLDPRPEIRVRTSGGKVEVVQKESAPELEPQSKPERSSVVSRKSVPLFAKEKKPVKPRVQKPKQMLRVYPYGIARTRLERAIRDSGISAYITSDVSQADAVIAIRSTIQNKPRKLKDLNRQIPTVVVKSNTFSQISSALKQIVNELSGANDAEDTALIEVSRGIENVKRSGTHYDLAPQGARLRKLQHQELERQNVVAEAVGKEPDRYIRILPLE